MAEKLALFTTVVLDQPRRIRFRPGVVRYRFGQIKKPRGLEGLNNSRTFMTTLCQWLYAVIDEDCDLDSPETIAETIENKTTDELVEIAKTLVQCVNLYRAPDESKNGSGSTPSPSPTSSLESQKTN